MIGELVVSYFPARLYSGIEILAGTIMNPICHSTRLTISVKDKADFAILEPVYD